MMNPENAEFSTYMDVHTALQHVNDGRMPKVPRAVSELAKPFLLPSKKGRLKRSVRAGRDVT